LKEAVRGDKLSVFDTLSDLLFFPFSDKLKFAIKTSLAMTLAYLIPFSQGWTQPQTAVITILLIAAAGPLGESISKGVNRVLGTIVGAIIGMTLIALFPQDRILYLLFLSLFVSFFLYLTRAYKGDMTVFMLTAVTMMMVFKSGEVDDVFIYGIDRTYMTIVGVVLYTLVGIFIWPVKTEDNILDQTAKMLELQSELYQKRADTEDKLDELHEKLQAQEKMLEVSVVNSGSETLNYMQRNILMQNAQKINEFLNLLSYYDEADFIDRYSGYVSNLETVDREIEVLFGTLKSAAGEYKSVSIPERWKPDYDYEAIKGLSHIDRTELVATVLDVEKLHRALCEMAAKFNALISPAPTHFDPDYIPALSKFNWLDIEDLKGTLISFLIFWVAALFWIYVNPPAGFLVVTLATALSVLTTFSPLKPSLLIIVFTFAFIFATTMYILVLPNIHYGWELGLFIFLYAFIGFYFVDAKISMFFLFGMVVLTITNPMIYNFNLFLMILFVFYLFLFILLLFYYIPFSTKPEMLFLTMKKRFFTLASCLMQRGSNLSLGKETWRGGLKAWYAEKHLMITVRKMQLWASKIDTDYFDDIDQKALFSFNRECNTLAYMLNLLHQKEIQMTDNHLLKLFFQAHKGETLAGLLSQYAQGKEVWEIDTIWKEKEEIVQKVENNLQMILSDFKADVHIQEEAIAFYENISLRRNIWNTMLNCQKTMEQLDFKVLERSRF